MLNAFSNTHKSRGKLCTTLYCDNITERTQQNRGLSTAATYVEHQCGGACRQPMYVFFRFCWSLSSHCHSQELQRFGQIQFYTSRYISVFFIFFIFYESLNFTLDIFYINSNKLPVTKQKIKILVYFYRSYHIE